MYCSNYSGPLDSSYRQTNNSAEINAVLNALDIIRQYGSLSANVDDSDPFLLSFLVGRI